MRLSEAQISFLLFVHSHGTLRYNDSFGLEDPTRAAFYGKSSSRTMYSLIEKDLVELTLISYGSHTVCLTEEGRDFIKNQGLERFSSIHSFFEKNQGQGGFL